jgi:hypothetical protein
MAEGSVRKKNRAFMGLILSFSHKDDIFVQKST